MIAISGLFFEYRVMKGNEIVDSKMINASKSIISPVEVRARNAVSK